MTHQLLCPAHILAQFLGVLMKADNCCVNSSQFYPNGKWVKMSTNR